MTTESTHEASSSSLRIIADERSCWAVPAPLGTCPERSLYQITQDPGETRDLYASSAETAQRLEAELARLKNDLPAIRVPVPEAAGGLAVPVLGVQSPPEEPPLPEVDPATESDAGRLARGTSRMSTPMAREPIAGGSAWWTSISRGVRSLARSIGWTIARCLRTSWGGFALHQIADPALDGIVHLCRLPKSGFEHFDGALKR